jgi:hypothetical protein
MVGYVVRASSRLAGVISRSVQTPSWWSGLYDRAPTLLTSEDSVVQGCDLAAADATISDILAATLAAKLAL